MTARKTLNRKLRWSTLTMLAGMSMFFGGMIVIYIMPNNIGPIFVPMLSVMLTVVLVNFAISVYVNFGGLHCPRCRRNHRRVICRESFITVDRVFTHCPFCGLDLDEDLNNSADPTF